MLFHTFQILLRNIVHLGPLSRFADREVILGAVSSALGTSAPGLPTALVALDEGAPQHDGQVGQAPDERSLSSTQRVGNFVRHIYPTSYKTGRIVMESSSFVNSFFCMMKGVDKIFQSRKRGEIQKGDFPGFFSSLVGPLPGYRESSHRGSPKDQGIAPGYPADFEDGKTLTVQRVKGMRDFRPSQRCAAMMCF